MNTIMQHVPALKWLGFGALIIVALVTLYGVFHLAARLFGGASRRSARYARVFDRLARFFRRLTQLPRRRPRRARIRVDSDIATSMHYHNPVGSTMTLRAQVQYSYDALCALAYDLGVPREVDQTPYEFLAALPDPITGIEDEARTLTHHYVAGHYSTLPLPPSVAGDLRAFWQAYERLRGRMTRPVSTD
jgi:hypothetical protein